MKRSTDDEVIKKLEQFSEPFHPTPQQKENMYQEIFQRKSKKPKRQSLHWWPAVVSIILLISFISAITVLIAKPDSLSFGFFSKDVTESWEGVIMQQESSNDLTNYYMYFNGETMGIQNNFMGMSFMGSEMSESEIRESSNAYQAKLSKMTLQEGEYEHYTIQKKKDMYTITIPGEKGFTYTIEKIAPRKYMGEDGIRYSVNNYVE